MVASSLLHKQVFATALLFAGIPITVQNHAGEGEEVEKDYSLLRAPSGCLSLIPQSPTPSEFQKYFLDQQPTIFAAESSPSTEEDKHQWSGESLSRRHGGSLVILGTNKSLSLEGGLGDAFTDGGKQQLTLAEYLQPSGSPQPGYLFVTGIHASRKYSPKSFESVLLEEARLTTNRWWIASLGRFLHESSAENNEYSKFKQLAMEEGFKQWAPVIAISGVKSETSRAGSSGIPFHRHHASWLHLLHGTKLWHFFPPDVTPHEDNGLAMGGEGGHSEWITTVLPTLDDRDKPFEYVQHAGETVYVPEAWWHATSNIEGGGTVVGLGGQAESPQPSGLMELANEMESLMQEQKKVKQALQEARNARDKQAAAAAERDESISRNPTQGVTKLSDLRGDVLLAVIRARRAEGQIAGHMFADVEGECNEAANTLEAAIAAPDYLEQATHKQIKLLFDTANVQWCAGRTKQAGDNYVLTLESDPNNNVGIKGDVVQNLLELARDHLKAGELSVAIQRAGDVGMRGIPLLEHLHDIGNLKEDEIMIAACNFQLQRIRGGVEAPSSKQESRAKSEL